MCRLLVSLCSAYAGREQLCGLEASACDSLSVSEVICLSVRSERVWRRRRERGGEERREEGRVPVQSDDR